ncbi:hypothetical protein IEE92_04535 [Kocuria sp. cx-116]|uniref:hypothetical protein n=1 Tax=Kocuria sp. cx-116 TaxID=2771378 RepID=UPI001689FE1F|nr:hypothetical protein [Kocuria sp. cx-116]MBD2761826.1 hypothetical protein [Kocuria sp. cx-116]
MRKKASFVAATALSIPLLLGCGQTDTQATSEPAADSPTESTSPAAQTAHGSGVVEPSQDTKNAGVAADPAATENGQQAGSGEQLPAVSDPCAAVCSQSAVTTVTHPKYGPMTIVAYEKTLQADSAPQVKEASYGLYQNGAPVGYVGPTEGATVIAFTTEQVFPQHPWELANETNVDKHGNVFFNYVDGVTVLTPTEQGYDSKGTMPPPEGEKAPFSDSGLKIDESGEATIIQKKVDENGHDTGQTVEYAWDGSGFAPKK